jgi:hypothetical protein
MSSNVPFDTNKTVDVSAAEFDRIQRRAAMRAELKAEFNRQEYNPYRMAYRVEFHDPAVERFMAARVHMFDYWKPTWKSFWGFVAVNIAPIGIYAAYLTIEGRDRETKFRSGEIDPRARGWKTNYVPDNLHC